MKTHCLSFQLFIHNPPGSIILPLSKIPKTPPLHAGIPSPRKVTMPPTKTMETTAKARYRKKAPEGVKASILRKTGQFLGSRDTAMVPNGTEKPMNVHSRKLNMELKNWKFGRWFSFSDGNTRNCRYFLLEQSDETLSWVQSKSVQNELLKSMKKWVVSV